MQYLKDFIQNREKVLILVVGIGIGLLIGGLWSGMGF
jgi:hypothetical protein